MSRMPTKKYRPYAPVDLPDRTWPSRTITRAPLWCSVDLRDGNQALVEPMGPGPQAPDVRRVPVRMGFKEIEVGFPSACAARLRLRARVTIETDQIPDDVTIQVLTQAREHLIRRTFEALHGAKRAIVHLYNSIVDAATARGVRLLSDRLAIRDIALRGTELCAQLTAGLDGTDVRFEYSPESFTGTELDFALEVCEGVMGAWGASAERKVILNLPATVEMAAPNVYADQVEWMGRHFSHRDWVVLSLHPHNDRGTAVAAAELGMMAGADRVEGTLFGNGERTGNVDVVTLALNLLTQGVDPELKIHDIDALVATAEYCNRLPVHPRQPYAGGLVFTAFSGSHQDAIRKGLAARRKNGDVEWAVPYLPIDPSDLGRTYEAIIRINSQSGKGGVGYVLETDYGFRLPRDLLVEFSRRVQEKAERTAEEVSPPAIYALFESEYLDRADDARPDAFRLDARAVAETASPTGAVAFTASVSRGGDQRRLSCAGAAPAAALVAALHAETGLDVFVSHESSDPLRAPDEGFVAYVEAHGGRVIAGLRSGPFRPSPLVATLLATSRALNRLGALAPRALGRRADAVVVTSS